MSSLRTAVIGYGLGGAVFHAPFVAATPGIELAAIVTGDPGRAEAAATAYPEAEIVPTVPGLWAGGPFDLVVITTPNRWHVPLALEAIEHGASVVLDKPMAATATDGRRLIDTAEAAGVMLTVFQNRRWDGDFLTLGALVDSGALGTVHRLESRFERWVPDAAGRGWREEPDPAQAGGLLFDLGSHLIDQALVLLGPARSVYAELDRRRAGAAVDDDTFVALTHDSGARSHLWMSAVTPQLGPRFRVLGSTTGFSSWGLDPQESQLQAGLRPGDPGFGAVPEERWGRLGAGDDTRPVPMRDGAYQSFWDGVVAALIESAPPPVDPTDSVTGLEIIAAAQRSAAEGRVVEIEAA